MNVEFLAALLGSAAFFGFWGACRGGSAGGTMKNVSNAKLFLMEAALRGWMAVLVVLYNG